LLNEYLKAGSAPVQIEASATITLQAGGANNGQKQNGQENETIDPGTKNNMNEHRLFPPTL